MQHQIIKIKNSGHDILSVSENTPGAKDQDILEQTNKESRIILTFDKDYGEMVFRHGLEVTSGVVYFRLFSFSPDEPAVILLRILEEENISIPGKFTIVEKGRVRQRAIPNP